MKSGLLDSEGRDNNHKWKKSNTVNENEEDTSSLTAKIRNIERQMLEVKLMLLGDDGERLKPEMSAIDSSVKSQEYNRKKVNFRVFETGIHTSDMADVQIPMSSVLVANA
ncbi:hypothetical protein Tco_0803491, partial [Tanacetum coccineum]